MKKLIKSPFFGHDLTSDEEEDVSTKALGLQPCYWRRVQSLMRYAQHLFVNICNSGKITIVQHPELRKGLCTYPTLVCEDCKASTPIVSSCAGESHRHAVNLRSSLAKVAIGESHSSFETFCCLTNLPPPSSKSTFVEYHQLLGEKSQLHVEDSLKRAREEVRQFYGAVSESKIVDCLVSVDGTWQKRGHQSLLGAVYVIEYQTGKVLDYKVFCKFCHDCNLHKNWYKELQISKHGKNLMKANVKVIDGSSDSMEPVGLVQLFKCSLDYKLRYKHFISDEDSSTLASNEGKALWRRL